MFTLEINGTPIAVTDADESEARELFASNGFKQDLREFTTGGKPVWDGSSPFVVRAATEKEVEYFDDAALDDDDFDDDEEDGDDVAVAVAGETEEDDPEGDDFDDGSSVLFLIEIDQLGEDAFDDEA